MFLLGNKSILSRFDFILIKFKLAPNGNKFGFIIFHSMEEKQLFQMWRKSHQLQSQQALFQILTLKLKTPILSIIKFINFNTTSLVCIYYSNIHIDQQCEMLFTSVSGHLIQLKYLDKYKSWPQWNPFDVLNGEVESYIPEDKSILNIVYKQITEALQKNLFGLSRRANKLILWLDCDREGEAIAFEVLEVCKSSNPNLEIYRAHFSALTKPDISKALNSLRVPDENLSNAVLGRQEIDLRIGASFTRFQTLLLRRNYSLQGVISYGPCQFPTLGFVVNRFLEIENFQSEQFWSIVGNYLKEKETFKFSWERGRLFSEYECLVFYEMCLEGPTNKARAKVKEVIQSDTRKLKPLPMSTIEFEKLATKKLRISAHQAMEIAEKLYNQGYISYPRTETNKFPNTMNLKNLVEKQQESQFWGDFAKGLLDYGFEWPRSGSKDDKAHPPIHPVKLMNRSSENDLEFKVYELIARHFLAACSKNALGKETNLKLEVQTEQFGLKGLLITEYNYLTVYPYDKWSENVVPELKKNEIIQLSLEMTQGQTTPPPYLTETELISLMDKNGIGTDATIHEHIKTIQDRDYAKKYGQIFKPTKLGIALVETYRSMGTSLHLPQLRATMEQQMSLIANGQLQKDQFVQDTITMMGNILKGLQDNKSRFIEFVGTHLQQLSNYSEEGQEVVQRTIEMGLCGKCNQTMQYQELQDGVKQLKCNPCTLNLKLPFKGNISYKAQSCPICNFQILEVQKENGKQYLICPFCYNNSPQDDGERMPCFKCKFVGCPFSAASRITGSPYNCTQCKNQMSIKKTKKNTVFIGCSTFPKCRQSCFLPDMIKNVLVEVSEISCSDCLKLRISSLSCRLEFTDDELIFGNLLRRSQDPGSLFCLYPGCDSDIGSHIKWNNSNQKNNEPQNSLLNQQNQQQNQRQQFNNREQQRPLQNNQNKSEQFRCFKCGEQGHFAPQCPNKNNQGNAQNDGTGYQNSNSINQKNSNIQCFKCKQMGHYASSCQNNSKGKQENQRKEQKKVRNKKKCLECGVEGRHPKNSTCNLKGQKKMKKQQINYEDDENDHQ